VSETMKAVLQARAFLRGQVTADQVRSAIETLCEAVEQIRPVRRVSKRPASEVLERIRRGEGCEPADVVRVYSEAFARIFGSEDRTLEAARAKAAAGSRALALVRREFKGDAVEASRFVVRCLRYWQARALAHRWPGPELPTFDRLCHARMIDAYRRGEFERA